MALVFDSEHRQLWMPGEDFAVRSYRQRFTVDRIGAASRASPAPTIAAPAVWTGREVNLRDADDEARAARIDPIGEGPSELMEGRCCHEVGERAETLGLQHAHIHGERGEKLRESLGSRSRRQGH